MGCGCKKPKNVQAVLVPTPTPEPIRTPDELHSKELNEWYNNLEQTNDIKTDDNGE